AVLEQDVRRFHVAMHDPARVRMRETLEHLCCRLDGCAVGDGTVAERIPEGPSGDVLVGDVDVSVVATEVVRADAPLVPQARCCSGLARGPWRALPPPRDDLERDVETGALVACKPHRAGAAAPERSERPVPVEDELSLLEDARGRRHDPESFGAPREGPSRDEQSSGGSRRVPTWRLRRA